MRLIKNLCCVFLVVALALSTIVVYADQGTTQTKTKFITGVIFVWGRAQNGDSPALWEPAAPGDRYIVNTAATLERGAKNIRIYPYDGKCIDPGKATFGARNKLEYNNTYMPYAAKNVRVSAPSLPDQNGKITYSYEMNLNPQKMLYDVKSQLNKGKEQKIRDLLGYVSPEIEQYLTAYKGQTLAPDIEGYLYFVPYVIQWDVTKCSVCGKCPLTDGAKCSETTCENWAQPDCGCYYPPFVEPEQPTAPPDTKGCSSVIQWSETKSHTWFCGGCLMGGGCPGHTCNHVYTYQTALKSTAALSPSTLKSGYGFEVTVNNSIKSGQLSNQGVCGKSLTKPYANVPKPPEAAEVWTNWTVRNQLGTQFRTIQLEKSSSTNNTSKFQCKKNRISEKKERKIYTDVALKGTAKKPVSHSVSIVISGGGVKGIPFCTQLDKSITINGDMYEDDFTVDRKVK